MSSFLHAEKNKISLRPVLPYFVHPPSKYALLLVPLFYINITFNIAYDISRCVAIIKNRASACKSIPEICPFFFVFLLGLLVSIDKLFGIIYVSFKN